LSGDANDRTRPASAGTFATTLAGALSRAPRWLGAALFLSWAALMFILSAEPAPEIGRILRPLGAWGHNTLHAPEYAVFALLFLWATARANEKLADTRRRVWVCVVVVLLYGASDEWHQSFTPGRDASVCDVLTDLTGGVSAVLLLRAAEEGAGHVRMLRILVLAVLACALAALIATLLPATRPDLTWL
jgi:VanZ family protein